MTSAEIREILKGNFSEAADRAYWEAKLAEAERKEKNGKENEKYFEKMQKYNR